MNIVFLPIDERFCTRDYFIKIAESGGINVKTPKREILGKKKIPADTNEIKKWLLEKTEDGDILIISSDMLIHGGLIPSRINQKTIKTSKEELEILKKLKIEKNIKIYIGTTVTRIPRYNSNDEEPDYWEYFGKNIKDLSKELTKNLKEKKSLDYFSELKNMKTDIKKWILDDFFWRRKRNFNIISYLIDLLSEGTIDYLNLTLDDNEEGNLSVYEANFHKQKIEKMKLNDKSSIHPGADESSLTMLSRALCDEFNVKPKFKVIYTIPEKKELIPPYEGESLDKSVENHIKSSGGKIVQKNENDIDLIVNNFNEEDWGDSSLQKNTTLNYLNLLKIQKNKITGICDVKYANGSDNQLIEFILDKDIDWKKFNISGWNTAGNTIGTVCAHSIIQWLGKEKYINLNEKEIKKIQFIFLLEHWGYQANIRKELREVSKEKGCNLFTLMPAEKWAEEYTKNKLIKYKIKIEEKIKEKWDLDIYFPWHRSFEVGIELKEVKK